MKVLGVDPGLANFGWCLATYDQGILHVDDMGTVRTEKSKRKLTDSEDNHVRGQKIAECLEALVLAFNTETQRHEVQVECICAEAMSYVPSAANAAKMSRSWGVVDTISYQTRVAVLQRSPQEIKIATAGSKKASKAGVIAAMSEAYPEIRNMLAPWPKGQHEHMVDALGAIVACLDDNLIKMFTDNRNRRVAR